MMRTRFMEKLKTVAVIAASVCLLLSLLSSGVSALNEDNYKVVIEKISVGAPVAGSDGRSYLPVEVHFSASEDIGDENAVYFLEGYIKAKLKDGKTSAEGVSGLGMTLMRIKPDAAEGMNNVYTWDWQAPKGTGVLKYNIPLGKEGEEQKVEKNAATGQEEVNYLAPGDTISFSVETVLKTPEGQTVMSDPFQLTVEEIGKYPLVITSQASSGDKTSSSSSSSDKTASSLVPDDDEEDGDGCKSFAGAGIALAVALGSAALLKKRKHFD